MSTNTSSIKTSLDKRGAVQDCTLIYKQLVYSVMETLEHIINHKLHRQLQLIQNKRLYPHMDWIVLERIFVQELVPSIANEVSEALQEKEEANRILRARLNQLKLGNDPERDKRIVELYNQGLSRGQIAKEVDMSKWGVSKALRRLGQLG